MNVQRVSTGTLRAVERWLDALPLFVLARLRIAVKTELLMREIAVLADECGGYLGVTVGGWN